MPIKYFIDANALSARGFAPKQKGLPIIVVTPFQEIHGLTKAERITKVERLSPIADRYMGAMNQIASIQRKAKSLGLVKAESIQHQISESYDKVDETMRSILQRRFRASTDSGRERLLETHKALLFPGSHSAAFYRHCNYGSRFDYTEGILCINKPALWGNENDAMSSVKVWGESAVVLCSKRWWGGKHLCLWSTFFADGAGYYYVPDLGAFGFNDCTSSYWFF